MSIEENRLRDMISIHSDCIRSTLDAMKRSPELGSLRLQLLSQCKHHNYLIDSLAKLRPTNAVGFAAHAQEQRS